MNIQKELLVATLAIGALIGTTSTASAHGAPMYACEPWHIFTVYNTLDGQTFRQKDGMRPPPAHPGYHWMCQPILIGEQATEVPDGYGQQSYGNNTAPYGYGGNQGSSISIGIGIGFGFGFGNTYPQRYYGGWHGGYDRQPIIVRQPQWVGRRRW